MLVYRFLNEQYALEALQSKSLKVGRPSELNDPADCYPRLENVPENGKIFVKDDYAREYLRDIYRDVGLLCFSSAITDPVIWSHYADSHRGIALGYDFDAKQGSVKLFEVAYNERRPAVDYQKAEELRSDPQRIAEFIENVVQSGFSSKAPSWAYEKEHRLFLWLGRCKMVGSQYFVDNLLADEVVLGLRCRVTENDIIRAWSPHHPPRDHTKIKRACLDEANHSLIVRGT